MPAVCPRSPNNWREDREPWIERNGSTDFTRHVYVALEQDMPSTPPPPRPRRSSSSLGSPLSVRSSGFLAGLDDGEDVTEQVDEPPRWRDLMAGTIRLLGGLPGQALALLRASLSPPPVLTAERRLWLGDSTQSLSDIWDSGSSTVVNDSLDSRDAELENIESRVRS